MNPLVSLELTLLAELSLVALSAAAGALAAPAVPVAVGHFALVVPQGALAALPLWLAVALAVTVLAVAGAEQGTHHCRQSAGRERHTARAEGGAGRRQGALWHRCYGRSMVKLTDVICGQCQARRGSRYRSAQFTANSRAAWTQLPYSSHLTGDGHVPG